jgi:hypothetical protein
MPCCPWLTAAQIGDKKPLPTFQSRVDDAGNVEVYI